MSRKDLKERFKRLGSRQYEKYEKNGSNGYVYDFSVNYDAISADDILEWYIRHS